MKLKKGKIIPGTYDPIFKTLLTTNKKYLSDIISGVTGLDYKEVYNHLLIKNSEFPIYNYQDQKRVSDLIVEVKRNLINIEMNRYYYELLDKRNESYIHKMACTFENEADTFIQINLDNFNRTNEVFSKYQMMNTYTMETLGSIIKYSVNLALIEEKYYNKENLSRLEKELLMLRLDDKKELEKLSEGDSTMKEVNDKLVFLSDEKIKELEYDYEEKVRFEATQVGLEEGRAKGLEEGKKQGIEQGIEQVAKNMLKENMSVDEVSKLTGLSKEKIEGLK